MPNQNYGDNTVFQTFNEKTVKKAGEETLALWSPNSEKRFRLQGLVIATSAAAVVTLKDEATTIAVIPLATNATVTIMFPGSGYLSTKKGNKLNLEVSAEVKVTGTFFGSEE